MPTASELDPGRDPSRALRARDLWTAGTLALVFVLLYRLTACERFANDGPQLASVFVRRPDAVHWQVLYLPLARLVARLVPFGDPFEPLRLLSAAGGAVGVATCYLVARGFGALPRFGLAAALLIGVSRYAWFFGSTVEVHALHFGMMGLAACATLFAPWRRPAIALPIAALALGATWTTHGTAALFGPGWLALCAYGRARVAEPFSTRTVIFVVGPACLAGLLLVMLPLKTWWVATTGGASDLEWEIIRAYFRNADHGRFLYDGMWRPLGLVVPLFAVGLAVASRAGRGAGTLMLLLTPPTAFVVGWGVPEDGGYFLGHAPFHAVLVATALATLSRKSMILVPGVVFLQAATSWASIAHFDQRFAPDDRVELAREALGERAYLGKIAFLAPEVTVWLPGIEEVELIGRLHHGFSDEMPPGDVADAVAPVLAGVLVERPVAIDMSFRGERFDLTDEGFPEYVEAFATALLSRFEVELHTRGDWTFARLISFRG